MAQVETTCPNCNATLTVEIPDPTYEIMGKPYTGEEVSAMYAEVVGLVDVEPQPIWPKEVIAADVTDGRTGITPVVEPPTEGTS